jgi:hypothetical protein
MSTGEVFWLLETNGSYTEMFWLLEEPGPDDEYDSARGRETPTGVSFFWF